MKKARNSHLPDRSNDTTLQADLRTRNTCDSTLSRRHFLISAAAAAVMWPAAAWGVPKKRDATPVVHKVGLMIPRKGPFKSDARSLKAGIEMRLKEARTGSPKIKLIEADPYPDEDSTLTALAHLVVKKEVDFLIGPMAQDAAVKVTSAITDPNVVMFVTNPSVRLVAGQLCTPGSIRVSPNTYQINRPPAPWSLQNIGERAFITGSDDWLGNEQADFFAYGFERAGGQFTDRIMIASDGSNLADVMKAAEGAEPDILYAALTGSLADAFFQELVRRRKRLTAQIIGPESLTDFKEFPKRLTALKRRVITSGTLPDPESFRRELKKQTGKTVENTSAAAEGYAICDAMLKIAEHREAAGGNATDISGLLSELTMTGPAGTIRFDANHQSIPSVILTEWTAAGGKVRRKKLADLGECPSLDFGCGKVGFPKRREIDLPAPDELEPLEEPVPDE